MCRNICLWRPTYTNYYNVCNIVCILRLTKLHIFSEGRAIFTSIFMSEFYLKIKWIIHFASSTERYFWTSTRNSCIIFILELASWSKVKYISNACNFYSKKQLWGWFEILILNFFYTIHRTKTYINYFKTTYGKHNKFQQLITYS